MEYYVIRWIKMKNQPVVIRYTCVVSIPFVLSDLMTGMPVDFTGDKALVDWS